MMGALIRFSIRFPGVVIGLALLIIVYGIYQIKLSPLNVFPEFSQHKWLFKLNHLGSHPTLLKH